ncbi:hypothetical protein NGH43_06110 [Staphylococcus saprophyticus]|uniref:hypothetical protein n=1 Tax=Staphylococcus saprophyticus TaxID=29385 RepID=UPI002DBB632F|nr:hypothetical protein [Staphylococcus saprophyticus]MEB8089533.1 hypothetical protein [Staphylococcus saprophyticus]
MEREEALTKLSLSRSVKQPFEVTTDEHSYQVDDFREYDKDNVELVLIDNSTKVIPYSSIFYSYSEHNSLNIKF